MRYIPEIFKSAFLMCLFICGSCHNIQSIGDSVKEIAGTEVGHSCDAEDLIDAYIIHADNDNIYMRHQASSPLLSRFDIDNDSIFNEERFITVGNGPLEMFSLILYSLSSDGQLFVFKDPNTGKTLEFDRNNGSMFERYSHKNADAVKPFRFSSAHPRGSLVTYMSTAGSNTDCVLGLMSERDSLFLPLKGVGREDMMNLNISAQMHYAPNCQIFVQPGGEKCLFVSSTGQYVEIFEIEGDQATDKKILVDNVPQFSINERGRIESASEDLTYGLDVSITADRVYISPRRMTYADTKGDIKENPKFDGTAKGPEFHDDIWEYDWDGNLKGKYRLTPGFSSFQVSPSRVLWGISENDNNDAVVMRYNL